MAAQVAQGTDTAKLRKLNRELSILNAIAESLNREVDLTQALRSTLAQVLDLFRLKTGWIWLLHEGTGESYLAAAQNLPPALRDNPHKMEGSCHCLDTYHAGDMDGAANVNVITCSRLRGLVDGTDGLRYHSSVPLYAPQGKKLGVLNVASGDWREISDDDLRLLYTIGDLLSIAIERARLFGRSAEYGAAEERNRLAREIHDTLAQGLTAITLKLETAEALMDADSEEKSKQMIHEALGLARDSLEEARRSVLDLRAAPLEERTLAEALEALIKEHAGKGEPKIDFKASGGSHPLPVRVEAGLYRIAQEALNNAVQHAQADQIEVRLKVSSKEAVLRVMDDGKGFDPQADARGRFGLIGLNERVKLLGGNMDLQTTPQEGTCLAVRIPLEMRAA